MHACTRRLALRVTCWMLMFGGGATAAQEQLVDPAFKSIVPSPAYTHSGPTVAIDEAHANFHRASGQYRPFATMRSARCCEMRFGMNVPGTDNQQFGLNVLHWLSGLLP